MSPSEQLLNEIRASRPVAPPELRERIRLVAAQEPARPPLLERLQGRLDLRRFLVVATPATLAVAVVTAGVIGLTRPDSGGDGEAGSARGAPTAAVTAEAATPDDATQSFDSARESAPAPQSEAGGAIAPSLGRLQRFDAQLDLRVEDLDELSAATQRAMRVARSLGGHVQSVSYDAPSAGIGSAQMTLRVPIARVQSALVQLSSLGTIVGQRFGIEDLQGTADDLATQIAETQRQIAQLSRQLANPDLLEEERVVLQAQRAEARRRLTDLRAALGGTREEARLATVQLSLTTEQLDAAPAEDGAIDRILDILVIEGLIALYVLVIAGPLVLLAVLVWLVLRLRRRRGEARLLAQN
jgi:hypothetical protein